MVTTAESPRQYAAWEAGGVPEPEAIRDGLWSVPVPMPGGFLNYSLSVVHLGEEGAVTVIDPGWHDAGARYRLDAFLRLQSRALRDVRTVLVTHSHPDHMGFAAELRRLTGAQLLWGAREQQSMSVQIPSVIDALDRWEVPRPTAEAIAARRPADTARPAQPQADRLLHDGDMLDLAGMTLEVVHTPGHTVGHLCFVDHERRILHSGDHILPTVYPGIGLSPDPGRDPVADYLASVERISAFDCYEVVPGHGYRFRGLRSRREATSHHVRRRADEVRRIVEEVPASSIWEIASSLTWTGGWDQIRRNGTLLSALTQTEFYRAHVESATG